MHQWIVDRLFHIWLIKILSWAFMLKWIHGYRLVCIVLVFTAALRGASKVKGTRHDSLKSNCPHFIATVLSISWLLLFFWYKPYAELTISIIDYVKKYHIRITLIGGHFQFIISRQLEMKITMYGVFISFFYFLCFLRDEDMVPPKDPYIQVHVLEDIGELPMENCQVLLVASIFA
ncbi:hypothetical protein ACJX0J_020600 [Zea mays]